MTARDEHLWDPKAPPDAEVQALERALAPLAWRPASYRPPLAVPVRRRVPWPLAAVLLAAALVVAAAVWFAGSRDGALAPGGAPRTFVAGTEPLRVQLGDLAEITLRPGSEIDFVHWRPEQALFALRHGGIEAVVAPPPKVAPRFFAVDTPLGRAVDQGCRFDLELQKGSAVLRVAEGAVTFAAEDRVVYVPAGAEVAVGKVGAGTPLFADASAELRKAVYVFDEARVGGAGGDERAKTLKMVLATAREPRDSLVLWHLLRDPVPIVRENAEDLLLRLVGPPGGAIDEEHFDPEEWLAHLRLGVWR